MVLPAAGFGFLKPPQEQDIYTLILLAPHFELLPLSDRNKWERLHFEILFNYSL